MTTSKAERTNKCYETYTVAHVPTGVERVCPKCGKIWTTLEQWVLDSRQTEVVHKGLEIVARMHKGCGGVNLSPGKSYSMNTICLGKSSNGKEKTADEDYD